MKKFIKSVLSVALVVSMLLSFGITSFAENPGIISSHVEFEVTDAGVLAKAFVRDLRTKYKYDPASVTDSSDGYSQEVAGVWCQIVLAAYDANGRFTEAAVDTGLNRILETTAIQVPEGGYAKAFVWESNSKNVISNVALYKSTGYDFNAVLDTLEITFDGESFDSFVGTEFNKSTTTYNAGSKGSIPNVKATVKDNSTHVTAYKTPTAYIVEVKSSVGMGSTSFATTTNKGAVPVNANRPTYTNSQKYVINYTLEADKPEKINPAKEFIYMSNSESRWPNQAGAMCVAQLNAPTNHVEKNVASATVTVADEPVEVSVTINKDIYQNTFIVVRPATGANSIENKVIVNPDGSEITLINDWEANKSYTINDEGVVEKEPYKRSATNVSPVTLTPASGDPIDLWVGYDLGDSRTAGDNGANVSNRAPALETLHVGKANDTIKNAEWIPSDILDTVTGGGTFTFKVGQSAIIDVYARDFTNAEVTVKADGEAVSTTDKSATEEVWVVGTIVPINKSNLRDAYKPYFDLTLAYFDHMEYINGVHYKYDEEAQSIEPYDCIKYDGANNPNQSGVNGFGAWGFIALAADGNHNGASMDNSKTLDYYVNPQTDSRFWVDGIVGGTMKTREELADLFEDGYVWPEVPTFDYGVSNKKFAIGFQEYIDGLNKTYSTSLTLPAGWATGVQLNNNYYTFVPGTSASDEFKKICEDRALAVTEYETLLELEGSTILNACHEWNNGYTTPLSNYNGGKAGGDAAATFDTPFYTFTVNQDSEVIVVLPNNRTYSRTPNNVADGWVPVTAQVEGAIVMESAYNGWYTTTNTNIGMKYAAKGETVTIRVPMDGVRPLVFVRPL